MRQKSGPEKQPAEEAIKDIRRATRRHFSAEDQDPHRASLLRADMIFGRHKN